MIWPLNRRTADTDFPVPANGQPIPRTVETIDIICPHCKRHGKLPATKRGMIRCKQCQFAWDPIAEQEAIEKQAELILAHERKPQASIEAVAEVLDGLPPNIVKTLTSPRWAWWVSICRVLTMAVPGLGHMLIGLPSYSLMPLAFVCLIGAPFTLLTTLLGYLWLASWAESDFSKRLQQARAQAAMS